MTINVSELDTMSIKESSWTQDQINDLANLARSEFGFLPAGNNVITPTVVDVETRQLLDGMSVFGIKNARTIRACVRLAIALAQRGHLQSVRNLVE